MSKKRETVQSLVAGGFPGHDYAASAWLALTSSAEGNRSSPKTRT